MNSHSRFLTRCTACGDRTSIAYARQHQGKCKPCATGQERVEKGYKCPQCGAARCSAYQHRQGYVCDACCRQNDPEGYRREVMGYND